MVTPPRPFASTAVAERFDGFPPDTRAGLLELRDLIFETADDLPAAGRIEETLKWGQPAYLTPDSRSGTTIRLGIPKTGGFALYVHCQTTLLSEFQSLFPDKFKYEGNRAIHFTPGQPLPFEKLRLLIKNALTYHLK
ncbi:DUF1801 domain-containing protein [Aliiroseovarius sp. N1F302]|nr:DUF1801 domain-containing protein [Aliiroseovarius sediminis]MCI2395523.1 DUF1801 domain-containing protein [Aliiroseovarius sediminis]